MNIIKILMILTGFVIVLNIFLLIIAISNHEYDVANARASAICGWFVAFLFSLKIIGYQE